MTGKIPPAAGVSVAVDATDQEIEALRIPTGVKAAGWIAMATGALVLALAVQTVLIFRMTSFARIVVGAMVLAGIAIIIPGWGTYRGLRRSSIAAAIISAMLFLLSGAYAILGVTGGLISPLSFWVVASAVASTVATILAIGPATKISTARDSLRARGLDFGV